MPDQTTKEEEKENKQEDKDKNQSPKKKLVLDSSSIIMIVSLILIFLTTMANNAKILSAWIAWPLLFLFLACMILAMFLPKRIKKDKIEKKEETQDCLSTNASCQK